jgi:hypothetical protein
MLLPVYSSGKLAAAGAGDRPEAEEAAALVDPLTRPRRTESDVAGAVTGGDAAAGDFDPTRAR